LTKVSSKQAISIYYFLLFAMLIRMTRSISQSPVPGLEASVHLPFAWISDYSWLDTAEPFLSILLLIVLVITLPLIHFWTIRILWAAISLWTIGIDFAVDPGHSNHHMLWISILLAILPVNLKASDSRRPVQSIVYTIQFQILLIYALAGFWKARSFVQSLFDSNIAAGADYFDYAVASEFINATSTPPFYEMLSQFPLVTSTLSVGVLIFQLLCLPVAFFPKLYPLWGLLIALFHIASLVGLGIMFLAPVALAILFLTLVDPTLDEKQP
jgi:hypothetical protein